MTNEKKREWAHALLDKVLDIHDQGRHYAMLNVSNYGTPLIVRAQTGGFRIREDYDLCENFCDWKSDEENQEIFDKAMSFLGGLVKLEVKEDGWVDDLRELAEEGLDEMKSAPSFEGATEH